MSAYPSNRAETFLVSKPARVSGHGSDRTKMLLLGSRRSGKTSIQQVLFNGLVPKQTFYLETTTRIMKHTYDTVIPLEVWDCPGNITPETLGAPLSEFSTLIFVIDIRDVYNQPISKLVEFVIAASQSNSNLHMEVFVHKAEKLQEDDKLENFRQIQDRVEDRIIDVVWPSSSPGSSTYDPAMPTLNFHLTSVYDHSLHLAFSNVIVKLVPDLSFLENLLNIFIARCQSTKAFLFDTNSCVYVATDAAPVDSAAHNLCCDYLKMLAAFGPLYKSVQESPARQKTSSTPPFDPLMYPSASTTFATPSESTTLTYHVITPHLSLLAFIPTDIWDHRRGVVEHNVVHFRAGVRSVLGI